MPCRICLMVRATGLTPSSVSGPSSMSLDMWRKTYSICSFLFVLFFSFLFFFFAVITNKFSACVRCVALALPGADVPLASFAQLQEFNYTFDFNENTSARVAQRTQRCPYPGSIWNTLLGKCAKNCGIYWMDKNKNWYEIFYINFLRIRLDFDIFMNYMNNELDKIRILKEKIYINKIKY